MTECSQSLKNNYDAIILRPFSDLQFLSCSTSAATKQWSSVAERENQMKPILRGVELCAQNCEFHLHFVPRIRLRQGFDYHPRRRCRTSSFECEVSCKHCDVHRCLDYLAMMTAAIAESARQMNVLQGVLPANR